jgi:hypothetical protein
MITLFLGIKLDIYFKIMNKILNFLLSCIKITSGSILLLIIILFWLTALILTLLTESITSIELRLTRLMKKCFGEKL